MPRRLIGDAPLTAAERSKRYRDRNRGSQPRTPEPCPSLAAYKRHLYNGETPCEPCKAVYSAKQAEYYQARKRSRQKSAPGT